ncbi:MAG: hypothetical protein LAO23_08700 [Acidobacteriia bacterium]|nr:hypothetical protein [Terriglobia bacterium]
MNVSAAVKFCLLVTFAFLVVVLLAPSAAAQGALARQISSGGQGVFQPQPPGGDGVQAPEIDDLGQDADNNDDPNGFVNRTLPTAQPGNGNSVHAGKKAKSNPELNFAFDGLNFRQQRTANHGNQFSVEPPDQGLCAGNGFILESANDVLNVFDASGNQLLGVTDLNSFYGYAPAIVRGAPNKFGASVTDPSCMFDVASQRWFHVVLTLDRINVDANGQSTSQSLSGLNHLDLAVSDTSSPLGSWTIYRIPVQDDGTQGTPDHHCNPNGTPAGRTNPNACLGDYPHIGADANGFYITTNEFSLFGPGFNASQIYAISKSDLANNLSSITVFQYDTNDTPAGGLPGFTVWPGQSPSVADYASQAGGTEYFLSSFAVFTGLDNRLALWALTNTQALNSGSAPALANSIVTTVFYTNPPRSNQPGSLTSDATMNWPVGQCIENATCDLFLNGIPFGVPEVIGQLNSNDSRLQQVMLANGKLWGALGTGISTDGGATSHAGVAFFVITPQVTSSSLKGKIVKQGYVALNDASLTYPTTAATPSGRGVISFTVVGPNTNPSVGYVSLDAIVGAGDIHIAQTGAGLQDGFTEYGNIFGSRPRWGDYGAAVVVGNSIWFATEYINQSCDLATYEAGFGPSFGSCGGTRASLGNWATRITEVTP